MMTRSWQKPFTLVWAPEDPILGSGDASFLRRIPSAEGRPHAQITEASHFLFEDQPEAVANAILTAGGAP
jgi:pimeloyl-ACP methyl ester carboxylesterase